MMFKLSCMAGELARALAVANQVTDHGVKVPVLKATAISFGPDGAEFAATNTDHSIRVTIAAEGEGSVLIETALLTSKANALRPAQPVTISGDGRFLTIVQGKTRYKVPIMDPKGFPVEFTRPIPGEPVEIKAEPFFAAMNAAASTIVPDSSHTIGSGVFLDMTDGFRVIALQKKGAAVIQVDSSPLPNDLIMPLVTIRTAAAIFRDSALLDVVVNEDGICISDDGVMYRSKLIEGDFPNWRKIAAVHLGKVNRSVTFDKDELTASITRAGAIAEDRSKDTAFTAMRLAIGGGECEIFAGNRLGEEGLDVCPVDGDAEGILGLAIAPMTNILNTITAARIKLSFVADDAEAGMLIHPEPPTALDDYRIVMPMLIGA